MSSRTRILAAGAAAALAATVLAAPAHAAARPHLSASAPRGIHPHVASTYLAGYQTSQVGISRASLNFVVPTVSCPSADTQGVTFGVGNEQTEGSPTLLAVVFVACTGIDMPLYRIEAQAGPNAVFGTASAGDKVAILVTQSPTKATASVNNRTTAAVTKASGTPTPDNALTYGELPLFSGTLLPVPDFGDVLIQKPYLENSPLGAWSPTKVNRVNGGVIQIGTSPIFAGGGFDLTFQSN